MIHRSCRPGSALASAGTSSSSTALTALGIGSVQHDFVHALLATVVHVFNWVADSTCTQRLGADTDGDGTNDCEDGCPNDALKTEPGVCGCDEPEVPRCGDPLPPDIPFTGGGIIAISIDCSSSVTETEFILARTRVLPSQPPRTHSL